MDKKILYVVVGNPSTVIKSWFALSEQAVRRA